MDSTEISDQDLMELLGGDLETDAPEAAPEALPLAESVETAPSQPEQVAEATPEVAPAPAQDWNPEGPGDVRVALQQAREDARQAREQNAQLIAHIQQSQEQAQQEQQQLDPLDAEAHAYYQQRDQERQQQIDGLRGEMQTQAQRQAIQISEQFARADKNLNYDGKVAKFIELQSDPVLGPVATAALPRIQASDNPALELVRLVDRLSGPSPEDIQAQIQQGITKALDALKNPEKPTAPKTVGSIPAAAPNDQGLDLGSLTKADYKKHGLNILDQLD